MNGTVKDYSDAFLYRKGAYEKELFAFMMHCKFLDSSSQVIQDILFDLKRQRSFAYLTKILQSPNTRLCISDKPLARAFKSFVAKDVRGTDKNKKVLWIDLSGVVVPDGNGYKYRAGDLGIITSYLLAGMVAMVYHKATNKILNSSSLTKDGDVCFSSLVHYIIDYLRLSGDAEMRSKIIYFSCMYYEANILNKGVTESGINRALQVSGLSENASKLIDITLESVKDPYKDISTFVQGLAAITKASTLTLDVFIDKWMYHIGVGTQFGLEVFPAFANIMIYAYVGAYLNHQKTIEKVVGRSMVDFVQDVCAIGSELI